MAKRICVYCGEWVNLAGLFTCLDPKIGKPVCFACLFTKVLQSAGGCRCGDLAVGFVAVETEQGRVAPLAICPNCIVTVCDGSQVEVVPDENRLSIPDAGTAG